MSESRDEATGQFASAEPLFGQAALEHDAGFVPMPDEIKEETAEELTTRQAADRLAALSSTPQSEIRTYVAGANLPDNMTMTLDQGAKALSDMKAADQAQAETDDADKLRKEVDELRGVKPEEKGTKAETAEPAREGELEPELEKALNHPKIKEAIAAHISEAETVKHTYSKAVDVANEFARASFIEGFPEIAALPLQQWEPALRAMSQREPERFNKAMSTLNRVAQLQNAQAQQQQQKAQAESVEFQNYAKAENARFESLVKGESKATMRAVENEIPGMLKEYGADVKQFLEAVSNQSTFPRATAERILVDAAKYRMLMKAPKAVASRTPIPPVQRPGTSQRSSGNAGSIQALEASFASATGDKQIRLAAQLSKARRTARGG